MLVHSVRAVSKWSAEQVIEMRRFNCTEIRERKIQVIHPFAHSDLFLLCLMQEKHNKKDTDSEAGEAKSSMISLELV